MLERNVYVLTCFETAKIQDRKIQFVLRRKEKQTQN